MFKRDDNPQDENNLIVNLSGAVTIGIAIGSFTLSFRALESLAAAHKIAYPWIFPLILEGGMVAFSLSALVKTLNGEPAIIRWTLIVLSALLAGYFNYAHADPDNLSRFVALMPSLILFLTFETFLSQVKDKIKRDNVLKSIGKLQADLEDMSNELEVMHQERDTLASEVSHLSQQRDNLTEDLDTLMADVSRLTGHRDRLLSELSALGEGNQDTKALPAVTNGRVSPITGTSIDTAQDSRQAQYQQRLDTTYELLSQGWDMAAIAETLGVTERTIRRYIKVLENDSHAAGETTIDRIIAAADQDDRTDIADIVEAARDGWHRINSDGQGVSG